MHKFACSKCFQAEYLDMIRVNQDSIDYCGNTLLAALKKKADDIDKCITFLEQFMRFDGERKGN